MMKIKENMEKPVDNIMKVISIAKTKSRINLT